MNCRVPRTKISAQVQTTASITLSGFTSSAATYLSVTIDGTKYTKSQTITTTVGSIITIRVWGNGTSACYRKCKITYPDGTSDTGRGDYTFTVTNDITITGKVNTYSSSNSYYYGTVVITNT